MRWAALLLAVVTLNASVSFENVWPTLGIEIGPAVSAELAIVVLGLLLLRRRSPRARTLALRALAAGWVCLILGRYTDVTTRSLFGRDLNLYWDVRHLPNVGAMFAVVADPWLAAAFVAGLVAVPLALYGGGRWALGRVSGAMDDAFARPLLVAAAGAVVLAGGVQTANGRTPDAVAVSEPVAPVYVRELGELAYEMSGAGARALDPPPLIRSDFRRVAGADVILVFLESYGAVSWDNPALADGLAESRRKLRRAIADTERQVRSAFVEATTFGGESWLSHITLLSGTEVRDQRTNIRLMAQDRDTLVKAFGRHGYRTVAIMPGIQISWPQGRFYGFDEVYDLGRLDYEGPPFGWWSITDQFALARMDELEIAPKARSPVFAVFPTITTHAPFVPTPPYQPDWSRVLGSRPFDADELERAWSDYPDWLNLRPSYVKALGYALDTLAGYLRLRADRDLVLIVVGDHQPPALVSGTGASWDVPVHVVSSRPPLLERLERHGFSPGLVPMRPTVARMDGLLPVLLDAFGDTPEGVHAP